ncbi:MAG: hypothetical protein NWE76_09675 [Candidatus Bathyarchaeota archaeon]|nr:hypothetical protein [Candidatus Bathyarchaeota archaeon]
MTNILLDLELDELSLVDRPANQAATICLIKRDEIMEDMEKGYDSYLDERKMYYMDKGMGEDEAMKKAKEELDKMSAKEKEELMARLGKADEAEVEQEALFLAEVDALKAEVSRLSKALEENGYVVSDEEVTKAEEPEYIEVEGEQVAKSDIPAPVLKALEEAAIEKRMVELRKQAEEILPNFDNEIAASILAHVAKDDAIVEALKSADAALGASMSEIGEASVEADMASSSDKLDALVKSYMDDNNLAKKDHAKAYAAVAKTDEGKALISKLYKGE